MSFDNNQGGGRFQPKKLYDVDAACSKCGAKIDKLPFEPDPQRLSQLLCRDCHRARMQTFRR
jgi:CxxC-x17-CxxC domain-containing protein